MKALIPILPIKLKHTPTTSGLLLTDYEFEDLGTFSRSQDFQHLLAETLLFDDRYVKEFRIYRITSHLNQGDIILRFFTHGDGCNYIVFRNGKRVKSKSDCYNDLFLLTTPKP